MFRQDEVFIGGWQEKTLEFMQKKRFDQMVSQMPPLGAARLEALDGPALQRRIERSWQNIERKPMRAQQLEQVRRAVMNSMAEQAACLSREEHELVERALILGGSAQIAEQRELEAARALSLRLWGSVGLVSGRPYFEMEIPVARAAARAFAQDRHDRIRQRLDLVHARLHGMLYRVGAMDDRRPQRMIVDVLRSENMGSELSMQLARRYLWAGFDCVDYSGGVMLLHAALAEPQCLIADGRRRTSLQQMDAAGLWATEDILPEEIPLQDALERAIAGTLRDGRQNSEVAKTIRFLCKQGAPLRAMEDVLQTSVIVYLTDAMRSALRMMYCLTPKWIECTEDILLQ
ncbi:MAG: hypothetical protein J6M47_05950 [Clostridia bacterium]|nr:hypothetical protein [Clostridia bacterium]